MLKFLNCAILLDKPSFCWPQLCKTQLWEEQCSDKTIDLISYGSVELRNTFVEAQGSESNESVTWHDDKENKGLLWNLTCLSSTFRGHCISYAFSWEDKRCPSDVGNTWLYKDAGAGVWPAAGEGLSITCIDAWGAVSSVSFGHLDTRYRYH